MSITGAMELTTRGRPSCRRLSTLNCWWNGSKRRSTMKNSFQ